MTTNAKSCFELLESSNVCPRCILRFYGEKNYKSYISKENVYEALRKFVGPDLIKDASSKDLNEKNAIDYEPQLKHHRPSICCTCLGILQDNCDTMADKVEIAVKSSEFQFSDFTIQLSLPVTTDLRQLLMHIYMKDSLGSLYEMAFADIPSVKEIWKWVVGSQFGDSIKAEFNPYGDFQILVTIQHPELVSECSVLLENIPEAFPKRKKKKVEYEDIFTRAAVSNAMTMLSEKLLKSLYSLPPVSPEKPCTYEDILFNHSSLYLGGRYNKYSRELSQTPWVIGGERKLESSVQEHIIDGVKQIIISDKIVFSASGREDVDVKMLGDGRPFILEIINPRCTKWTTKQMQHIEQIINSSTNDVFVRDLQVISKDDLHYIKLGEESKRKIYSALCIVKKTLSDQDTEKLKSVVDLTIEQTTPIRVLHRRPLATRKKIIHRIQGEIVGPHEIKLLIETQAGTYIKEFVNGDFGRTTPSFGILLETEADILELDVMAIQLDWPPNKQLSEQKDTDIVT